MSALLASSRLQLALFTKAPGDLVALVAAPLFALVFLGITTYTGRTDLTSYAVVGPAAIAMLSMAITTSGAIIDLDRHSGVIELLLASATPLPVVVLGRIMTVTLASLVAVAESWGVAYLVFGVTVPVRHPAVLVGTLLLGAGATLGTAAMMAALFVRTRFAVTLQNSLSYPLYLLGGALVPVTLLPTWLQPLSRLVFLSWTTDLMRDSLAPAPVAHVWPRLGVLLAFAVGSLALGSWLIVRLANRARATGQVSHV